MAEFAPKVEMLSIEKLKPFARNSRTHSTGQIEKLARSIREFGFVQPILISKSNEIIAGHGRLRAAQKLEIKKVPCIRADHLTPEQQRIFVITDNRLSDLAGWDEEILGSELKELSALGVDLNLTMLSEVEIIQLAELQETDVLEETPGEKEQAKAQNATDRKKVFDPTDSSSDTGTPSAASESESEVRKGFSVMAFCETYAQQLDAMNALRALGIKCAAK
jgi:ParB-like chromosome segregation protein Spo0J